MKFSTLGEVARYLKGRDLGREYHRPGGLQGEFAFYSFDGFEWSDVLVPASAEELAEYRSPKYKPELLADIKLRFVARKLHSREYMDRVWDAKDGPQVVGSIEKLTRPSDPARPFTPVLESGRKYGPATEALFQAKAWIAEKYKESEVPAVPATEPATEIPIPTVTGDCAIPY
jgi:hypothetical protein